MRIVDEFHWRKKPPFPQGDSIRIRCEGDEMLTLYFVPLSRWQRWQLRFRLRFLVHRYRTDAGYVAAKRTWRHPFSPARRLADDWMRQRQKEAA
jgi:hypothetical protein